MRLIVGVFVVSFLAAVVAAVLLIDEGALDGERELLAPTATATVAPRTPESTPTREPEPLPQGRERHVTLIDIETGATFPLWTETETASSIAFSADSGWLAFGRSKLADLRQNSAYRADLRQSPDFELEPLGEGYVVHSFSSRGDLALRTPEGYPAVLTVNGELHVLAKEGHARGWSPDGRWLSYAGHYVEDDDATPLYLVDIETWEERLVGASPPCNCDGGPSAIWAPDSAHFIYTGPGVKVPELQDPMGRTSVEIDDDIIYGWLDARRYVKRVNGDDDRDTIVSVDHSTGDSEVLFEDSPGSWSWVSPDWQHFAVAEFGGGNVRIHDRAGNIVAEGIQGEFGDWSPDGSLFFTYADGTECGSAALVYSTEGDLLVCAPSTTFFEDGSAAISPDNRYVAAVRAQKGPYPPADNDIYVTDLTTGVEREVAADLYGDIICIDWSPNSRFLVVGHGCGV